MLCFSGIQLPSQTIYMQNYLSIGVDALVTYNFHKARESPFYFMSRRLINKLLYFTYGTKDVLERECKDLDKVMKYSTLITCKNTDNRKVTVLKKSNEYFTDFRTIFGRRKSRVT